jgi:hypothetical protein
MTQFARNVGADSELRRATRDTVDRTRTGTTTADARETADRAAKGTAAGTGAAALGFLIGGVMAALGGHLAQRHQRRLGYGSGGDDFAASPGTMRR